MVLDDADQAPHELRVDGGDNLLFTDTVINERLIGVQMFDEYFSWRPLSASRMIEADGRALTRVRIDWAADQSGFPGVIGMDGTSIYTFHPDGRIHRDESFAVHQERLAVWLTGYVALDPLQFTHIDWTDNPDVPFALGAVSGRNEMARTEPEYICSYNAASHLRLGWAWRPVSPPGGAGPRVTENNPGPFTSLALQYDWYYGGNPPDETAYAGAFLLHVDTIGDGERCDAAPAAVAAFLAPPVVDISAPSRSAGAAPYDDGGGFYVIAAAGADEVTFTVEGGLAALSARLDGIDPTRDPTIDVDGVPLSTAATTCTRATPPAAAVPGRPAGARRGRVRTP
jgi:hypothetical protein